MRELIPGLTVLVIALAYFGLIGTMAWNDSEKQRNIAVACIQQGLNEHCEVPSVANADQ